MTQPKQPNSGVDEKALDVAHNKLMQRIRTEQYWRTRQIIEDYEAAKQPAPEAIDGLDECRAAFEKWCVNRPALSSHSARNEAKYIWEAAWNARNAQVEQLRLALKDLLEDINLRDHDCGDTPENCPVLRAKAVLARVE